ncbi:von Willebrand factor A domain-containing protein 5A-like [Carassius auratus]|uniref:von Willebrand factor A domain-containing protein 5A-like n=1 Tax=Carassius auratus TaxID=7957 RepID=A0A6P6MCZ6_CARAU|nr:von Willebrand factor A domain-containing protein 5A-like [Carassius auratus]
MCLFLSVSPDLNLFLPWLSLPVDTYAPLTDISKDTKHVEYGALSGARRVQTPASKQAKSKSLLGKLRQALSLNHDECAGVVSADVADSPMFLGSKGQDCYSVLDRAPRVRRAAPEPQKDLLLQLVSLQKASGCWDLDATLADVFGKTEDELTNQKPAQVDGSVWATLLALIWLYGCKIEQQVEWQFVAMKAASWIGSQKVGDLSQCVCAGNVLLGCQVTKETLGI